MSFYDKTGQQFGYLTALEYLGKGKWLCQCKCGRKIAVSSGHLATGHTKSCGCAPRPPRKNLLGKKFGRLIPIEWIGNGRWHCKCDCGNEVNVITCNLINGNTQSCGCLQKDRASEIRTGDLTNKRFGKLIVLERATPIGQWPIKWKCQCDCGGIVYVRAQNLTRGITNSCGCIKSKGEMVVNKILQKMKITFCPQYTPQGAQFKLSGYPMCFDFGIFNKNNQLIYLIEYQGNIHYEYSNNGWNNKENFDKRQKKDEEKRVWCKQNNITLIEIPYWLMEEEIEGLIKETLIEPDMEEQQENEEL